MSSVRNGRMVAHAREAGRQPPKQRRQAQLSLSGAFSSDFLPFGRVTRPSHCPVVNRHSPDDRGYERKTALSRRLMKRQTKYSTPPARRQALGCAEAVARGSCHPGTPSRQNRSGWIARSLPRSHRQPISPRMIPQNCSGPLPDALSSLEEHRIGGVIRVESLLSNACRKCACGQRSCCTLALRFRRDSQPMNRQRNPAICR